MSGRPQPRLTPEEYLAIDRAAGETRSEYYDGWMQAMSGASHTHGIITVNEASELRAAPSSDSAHNAAAARLSLRVR